jgi:hypothetical protein
VARDGLDTCVYAGTTPPPKKAPPRVTRSARPLPGEEYETSKPLPPAENMVKELPPASTEPLVTNAPEPANAGEPAPAQQPTEDTNGL